MEIVIKTKSKVDIKTLRVEAGVRYWEDATVNGIEDEDGELIPCRKKSLWMPVIDIDSGVIKNWERGKSADIHYKVCDAGSYFLDDEDGNVILSRVDDYVPDILCPEENGYGDYIIMKVDQNGKIANWKPDFEGFEIEAE